MPRQHRSFALTIACLLACSAGSAQAALVAHYDFNESSGPTLADSVGTADGVTTDVTFAASGVPSGTFGNAGGFNGSTSGVSFGSGGHPSSFDLGTSDFTISGWFKAPQNTATGSGEANRPLFASIDFTNGGWIFEIGRNDRSYAGKLFFTVGGSAFSTSQVFSDTRVDDNEWHWVAVVNSSGGIAMHIDGVLQTDTGTLGTNTATAPATTEAGFGKHGSSVPYVGELDEWRIYNEALGSEALNALYNQGVPEPGTIGLLGLGGLLLAGRRGDSK